MSFLRNEKMRGGKRKGTGGKKPKLPPGKKRVKGSITLPAKWWAWLRKQDQSQSKVIEKALEVYKERVSL